MKILLLLVVSILLTFNASADQRFESWQGLCHFAYDPNDDDNEVYFANCINDINTYDAADGQGRLAYGSANVERKYFLHNGNAPKVTDLRLKGSDASNLYPDGEYTTQNTDCVMVTSNYDAGADDNNETEYRTNDWDLTIKMSDINKEDKTFKMQYDLSCRHGIAQ